MCHSCFCKLCITPPHMLEQILRNGSGFQQSRALRQLILSAQIRGSRQVAGLAGVHKPVAEVGKQRRVYDAGNSTELPGKLIRLEGTSPVGDAAVDEAYAGAGSMFDFMYSIYGRKSVDNAGMPLVSTVHYDQGYDNAFWDGGQMVYGDGDEDLPEEERLFNRFTIAPDIIGHELTHGVTQYEANLAYWEQPGALNESISDVFGALLKQWMMHQQAEQADWLIGQGLFTEKIKGTAIRSMKEPGTAYDDPLLGRDPQPGHMDQYIETASDQGGVHINSGIPNRAFYLTAIAMGGFAWEKAGRIWYVALRDRLKEKSDFNQAARITHQVAGELFGTRSLEQMAVRTGWEGVGLYPVPRRLRWRPVRSWFFGKM